MSGRLANGQKVKVYSLFSSEQGALRLALQDMQPFERLHLPALLARSNTLVAEEWIDGQPLSKLSRAQLRQYSQTIQAFLHACQNNSILQSLAEQHLGAFCYINDYLLPRLKPWANWQPVARLLLQWQQARDATLAKVPSHLSHPDLSLSNLIVQRHTGKLYVIDNELLGVGPGWILDGNNSFCRQHPMQLAWDSDIKHFVKVAWRLRLVGSALDAGLFARAADLAMGSDNVE